MPFYRRFPETVVEHMWPVIGEAYDWSAACRVACTLPYLPNKVKLSDTRAAAEAIARLWSEDGKPKTQDLIDARIGLLTLLECGCGAQKQHASQSLTRSHN